MDRCFSRGGCVPLQRVSENADEPVVTSFAAHDDRRGVPRVPMLAPGPANRLVASALVAAVAAAWSVPTAAAPQQAGDESREVSPRRLLQRFDFEESANFNPGVPPQIYSPGGRPANGADPADADPGDGAGGRSGTNAIGYAPFGEVVTAEGVGHGDGRYSVRFDLDGASMVRFLDVPLEEVAAEASLLLRAWVKTDGIRHASVRVSACYLDAEEGVIGGIRSSEAVRAANDWRRLEVTPPPVPDGARTLQVWLEVVQPRDLEGVERDRFTIAEKDIRGTAYFDDIEVWQLPSVRFAADSEGIVPAGRQARIRLRCDDPVVDASTVELDVRDASGASMFTRREALRSGHDLAIDLPALPPGWYEAEGHFTHDGATIARRLARFAVIAPEGLVPEQTPRFGASLGSRSVPTGPAIDLARAAFVVLPVWESDTDLSESTAEIERLRPIVGGLLDRRVEPMFRVGAVPRRLASSVRLEADDALGLFSLGRDRWRPALEPWLLAFGQRVDHWFIGWSPVDAGRGDLDARLDEISATVGAVVAGPTVTLPWSPEEPVPTELGEAVERGRHALEVVADPAWRESGGEVFDGIPKGTAGMVRIVPLPADEVDARERAIDLSLRAIDAWRAGFDAISLEVDGARRGAYDGGVPGPAIEFAAWRQLAMRLSGRRFVAEIPLADGVRALLADGSRGPVLVAWSDSGDSGGKVSVDLGSDALAATDLWGRTQRIARGAEGHSFRIGREPLFIEHVDRGRCMLRRGFRVDPVFAESRRAPQEGDLVLANPWDRALSGTLTVVSAGGVEISPRTHRVEIAPGGEVRLPVQFSIPRSTYAGSVPVEVEVVGTADDAFRARLSAPLEVGFRKATVEPSWRIARSVESGALDIVLTLRVTNTGDAPLDLEAIAGGDGYAIDRKLITALPPRASAVRAFHFKDGVRRLSGREIRAGVHEPETDARLLERVVIPPLVPPSTRAGGSRFADADERP